MAVFFCLLEILIEDILNIFGRMCDFLKGRFVIIVERSFERIEVLLGGTKVEREKYIEVVERYGNAVYRVAHQYCGNRSDAEDVTQNTFIKLLQLNKKFDTEEYLRRWLFRVAINEAKNLNMSFWKKHMVSLEETEVERPCEFATGEQSALYEAVMQLPAKYRVVVHLYYFEEYSIKEIAEILRIKETTVQTQLMRARGKLKEILKEVWSDDE